MAHTLNTDPYEVQVRNAPLEQTHEFTHMDGTKQRYLVWCGGQWRGIKQWRRKRNQRDRAITRNKLHTCADYDDLVLPDRHGHSAKWDLY
jgi:hypothetical protein